MERIERQTNPWKVTTIAIVAGLVGAVGGGTVLAGVRDTSSDSEVVEAAVEPPRENCDRYAAGMHTNGRRVAKNGLFGGAIGAGVGAAGGAIVSGGHGAGKGAGIGALVGATAGTVYGLTEEGKKKDQARRAYDACRSRNG